MVRPRFPSDNDRYTVSLPEGMKERIKAAAKANNRSLNGEIVTRLQAWRPHGNPADLSTDTQMAEDFQP